MTLKEFKKEISTVKKSHYTTEWFVSREEFYDYLNKDADKYKRFFLWLIVKESPELTDDQLALRDELKDIVPKLYNVTAQKEEILALFS